MPPMPQAQQQAMPGASKSQWDSTLNANKAGAMSNAEDFTKQFMEDMFGKGGPSGGGGAPAPPPPQPQFRPQPQQQQQQQFRPQPQQMQMQGGQLQVDSSEGIDMSSNKPKKGSVK